MSEQNLHHLIASFHLLTLINIQIEEGSRVKTHLLHLSCLNDPWVSSLKLFQEECFKINSFEEMFKTISGFEKKKVFLNNHMFLLLYRVQGWGCSLNALYNCIYYMRCMNMKRYGINSIRFFVIGNSYVGGSFFSQCFGEKWAVF